MKVLCICDERLFTLNSGEDLRKINSSSCGLTMAAQIKPPPQCLFSLTLSVRFEGVVLLLQPIMCELNYSTRRLRFSREWVAEDHHLLS